MTQNMTDLPLKDEVAIITGASNGIGRGISLAYASSGASIVIADIDVSAGQALAASLNQQGHPSLFVETDIRREADLDRLVDEALRRFGRVDILVNNAGINAPGGLLGASRKDIHSVFDTDLIGPFILTQRVAQEMIRSATHGRMVCISSIHSVVAHYHPYYSCSKAGIERLVVDAALELAPFGIRVNGIRPGGIHVRGQMELGSPEITSPEVPLENRRGLPQEVGDLALFLVTDESRYITGSVVTIDGGLSIQSFSALNSRANILKEQKAAGIPQPDDKYDIWVNITPNKTS